MTEIEYKEKLINIIKDFEIKKISSDEFVERAQKLGEEYDKTIYHAISDFEDKELAWAKYWIEEIDYYGLETVQEKHFNFFEYINQNGKNADSV